MDKKMRLIFFGLAILLVISVFISFRLYNGKQALQQEFSQEKQKWQQENEDLLKKLSASEREKTVLKDKTEAIQKDLDAITTELTTWKEKVGIISKEKEELIEKLQQQPKEIIKEVTKEVPKSEPVADEYWAKILEKKAGLEIKLNELNEALKESRIELAKLSDEKQALNLEIINLKQNQEDLERKLGYNEKLANSLSIDLVREKTDKNEIIQQLQDLKKDKASLMSKLKAREKANISLADKLNKVDGEKEVLAKKVSDMNLTLQSKMDEIMKLKEQFQDIKESEKTDTIKSVELPPIVVKGGSKIPPPAVVKEGHIIAVNQENNFVVIDLGQSDGLRPGHKFQVIRGNKQIANIEVIQARASICAADILDIATGEKIRTGDLVR